MLFFVGLDRINQAHRFERCCISVNALRRRAGNFAANAWILDSGAFSEISRHGTYRFPVDEYVGQIEKWRKCGQLLRAASQDWMCEPFIVAKTGLSVREHQRLTIERYDAIRQRTDFEIMPVLQGFHPGDYTRHLRDYGDRLRGGQVVGVGSVCKRNSSVGAVEDVLGAIHAENPALRLHGFGLKTTALKSPMVRELLYSADSMAWSFSARKQGRDSHDWREAKAFAEKIDNQTISDSRQLCLFN